MQVGSGSITLTANSLDISKATLSTTDGGVLAIQTSTNLPLTIAPTAEPGTLTVQPADLAAIAPGFDYVALITGGDAGLTVEGDATFTNNMILQAGTGSIDVGDGIDAAGHILFLQTGGAVTGQGLVQADFLALLTGTGIGSSAQPLVTQVNRLYGLVTGNGDISLNNTGDLTVQQPGSSEFIKILGSQGSIHLTTTGNLYLPTGNVNAPGDIDFTVGGALTIGSDVRNTSTTGGKVELSADTIQLLSPNRVTDNGGEIDLRPFTPSRNVVLGDTTDVPVDLTETSDVPAELTLTAADLAGFTPGYALLTIENTSDNSLTPSITVASDVTFTGDVLLQTLGDINLNHQLTAQVLTLVSGTEINGPGPLSADTLTMTAPNGFGAGYGIINVNANYVADGRRGAKSVSICCRLRRVRW